MVHRDVRIGRDAHRLPVVSCVWFETADHGPDRQLTVLVHLTVHKLDEPTEQIFRNLQARRDYVFNRGLGYDTLLDTILHHAMTVPTVAPQREVMMALDEINAGPLVPNRRVVRFRLVHDRE